MSLIVFVGPSGIGKTFAIREWLLPMLLTEPRHVTSLAPERFAGALVHDPPTAEHPDGQYPITRYPDVASWRRAERRPRAAAIADPTLQALCSAAIEIGRLVLVLDDLHRLLGSERPPPREARELCEAGRHHGSVIVGGCRRLKGLNAIARGNVELAFFGNLADEDDRRYAAVTADVRPEDLRRLNRPGVFLEWDRPSGRRCLIRIADRRRLIIQEL
jgi:hypothetical protein